MKLREFFSAFVAFPFLIANLKLRKYFRHKFATPNDPI